MLTEVPRRIGRQSSAHFLRKHPSSVTLSLTNILGTT